MAVDVGSIDEGFGITKSGAPPRALQDERHSWRQLAHLGIVVAALIVETHACIENERAPLVLQLQPGICPVLTAFSCFSYLRVLWKCLFKVIAYQVADVVEFEVPIFGSKADVAFMIVTQCVGMVAFYLESIVLLYVIFHVYNNF